MIYALSTIIISAPFVGLLKFVARASFTHEQTDVN